MAENLQIKKEAEGLRYHYVDLTEEGFLVK